MAAINHEEDALPELEKIFCTKELDEGIIAFAVSEDGQLLAVGTSDDEIYIYDAADGTVKIELEGHLGGTNSLKFLKGTERLVSAGEDGNMKIWHLESAEELHSFVCDGVDVDKNSTGWTVTNVAVNFKGNKVACSTGKTVHMFLMDSEDPEENACVFPAVEGGVVTSVQFTAKDNLVFSFYGGINIAPAEPDTLATTMALKTCVLCIASSPDEQWFVGGCHDQSLHIWRLFHNTEIDGYECAEMACGGYSQKVSVANWQPGQTAMQLASAGGNACTIWNFEKSGPAGSMPIIAVGQRSAITCQAWKPDGSNWIVAGGKDGCITVFNLDEFIETKRAPKICKPLTISACPNDEIIDCAWTPQGIILVAFQSGTVRGYKVPPLGTEGNEKADLSEPR